MSRPQDRPTLPSGSPFRKTKLRPPAVAGDFVPRTRLREALRPGLESPLTLVSAPAGYGKTSLIADLVGSLSGPVAWVSLDEGDANLGTFARAVTAALRVAIPELRAEVETWLTSSPGPEELAARIADELDEIDDDVVLVLDELERAGSAEVQRLLESLLDYPPRPLRLVVTTRHDPPWPLANLRARGLLCEVRQADLAFTAAETADFVARATGREVGPAAAQRIHERTEGWPAAVRMIALALRGTPGTDDLLQRLPRGVARVEEYLAGEVLARQPDAVRRHLLRVSILESACASLCDALRPARADTVDGEAFLAHVRSSNLFVVEDDGVWLRLHPLLREHLAHVLDGAVGPEEIAALHDRARDWFDEQGDVASAIDHALRGGRPESAADVLARHRVALMNADRQSDIVAWVTRIRTETDADALVLRLLDAWYGAPMSELPGLLDAIETELAAGPPPATVGTRAELQGETHVLRALDTSSRFEFAEAASHARAALEQLPRASTAARSLAYFAQATNAQAAGDAGTARDVVAEGLEELAGVPGAAATVMGAELFVHWNEGEAQQVIATAERALAVTAPGEAVDTLVTIRSQAGITHYRRNELALAERVLRGPGLGPFPPAQHALARTLEALARQREADEVVADALRRAAGHRWPGADEQARALRAEIALRRGDLAQAMGWAAGVRDDELGAHSTARPVGVVLAAVLVAAGDEGSLARVDGVLPRLEEGAARAHRVPNLAEVLALRAAAAARRRDERGTLLALGRALDLTRRGSLVRTYLDLAPDIVPYLEHPDLPPDVRAHAWLIADAAGATQPRTVALSPQVLASDLTNREEDVLELLADRLTNKEIAQRLHVAPETVKRHLGNVYGKLHVHGRREAVDKARALGLLRPR